jgi:hypothetical protein
MPFRSNWKLCNQCQVLCYAGNANAKGGGVCQAADGDPHKFEDTNYTLFITTQPHSGRTSGSFALGAGDCTMLARAAEDSARPHVGAITATLGLTTTY